MECVTPCRSEGVLGAFSDILEAFQDTQNNHLQPVNLFVVSKRKDEFVHNSISTNSAADQVQRCIIGVAVNEVIQVEITQMRPSNATSQLESISDGHFQSFTVLLPWGRGLHMAPAP